MVGNLVLLHPSVVVSTFKKAVIRHHRFVPLLVMKLISKPHQTGWVIPPPQPLRSTTAVTSLRLLRYPPIETRCAAVLLVSNCP